MEGKREESQGQRWVSEAVQDRRRRSAAGQARTATATGSGGAVRCSAAQRTNAVLAP